MDNARESYPMSDKYMVWPRCFHASSTPLLNVTLASSHLHILTGSVKIPRHVAWPAREDVRLKRQHWQPMMVANRPCICQRTGLRHLVLRNRTAAFCRGNSRAYLIDRQKSLTVSLKAKVRISTLFWSYSLAECAF